MPDTANLKYCELVWKKQGCRGFSEEQSGKCGEGPDFAVPLDIGIGLPIDMSYVLFGA